MEQFKDGLTAAALARNLDISRTTVRRLCDIGVFTKDEHNKISLAEARKAYEEYQKNIKAKKAEQSQSSAKKLLTDLKPDDDADDDFKAVYAAWISNVDADPISVLNSARAYLTAIQTKQEKLKLDELEGRMFSYERVKADAEKAGELIRSKLITIPARVSTLCEGRTARDIEEIIEDEINNALEELQRLFV